MAKKNQNTSKKNVKNDSIKDHSVLEEINAKLKSGQKDLQKQVDELTTQVKVLGQDSSKSARKLLKSIEKSYHKKVAELHKDFDNRMVTFHKLQDNFISHLPKELVETLNLKTSSAAEPAKKPAKKPVKKTTKTTKTPAVKPKAPTIKAKSQKPVQSKALPKAAKTAKAPTIASINGIGPVTQKKLAEAGFTRLEDLANTPASKTEALKQFAKTKGFNNWQKEAQALLNSK